MNKIKYNEGFDTDTRWIKGNGWQICNDEPIIITPLKEYKLVGFTITNYIAGKISFNGKQIKIGNEP